MKTGQIWVRTTHTNNKEAFRVGLVEDLEVGGIAGKVATIHCLRDPNYLDFVFYMPSQGEEAPASFELLEDVP